MRSARRTRRGRSLSRRRRSTSRSRRTSALKPPQQDAAAAAQWLAADRRVAAALHALGEAALTHNFPAVTAAAQNVRAAGLASAEAADALGLRVCGR